MTKKEQFAFWAVTSFALLLGASINEFRQYQQDFANYISEQYEVSKDLSQIPLILRTAYATSSAQIKTSTESATLKEEVNPIILHTELILKYLPKYYPNLQDQSQMMPVFSCLMRNEAAHGMNKNCGDGGKACGSAQFHAPTYKGYRKIMIDRGLVDHMGDRLDPEDAIETMVWAFSDGRGKAWGPYLRGECK